MDLPTLGMPTIAVWSFIVRVEVVKVRDADCDALRVNDEDRENAMQRRQCSIVVANMKNNPRAISKRVRVKVNLLGQVQGSAITCFS